MPESLTISFVGTTELKNLLEKWAKENDRSVSWVMRQILTKEAQRRQAQPESQKAGNDPLEAPARRLRAKKQDAARLEPGQRLSPKRKDESFKMATQTLSQTPVFDNQISFQLLAEACMIAADTWRGQVDAELEQRIRSTPSREAAQRVFAYESLAAALEAQESGDAVEDALIEAIQIFQSLHRKKPVLASHKTLVQTRKTLATVYLKKCLAPALMTARESSNRLTQNNQTVIVELLTAACRGAAEAAAGTALEEQYLALALALGTDSPVERDEIISLFISPPPPASVDPARQEWANRLNAAIAALVEWRGALLSDRLSLAGLSLALEEIEAAGLLDWLEPTGNIDELFEAVAGGER